MRRDDIVVRTCGTCVKHVGINYQKGYKKEYDNWYRHTESNKHKQNLKRSYPYEDEFQKKRKTNDYKGYTTDYRYKDDYRKERNDRDYKNVFRNRYDNYRDYRKYDYHNSKVNSKSAEPSSEKALENGNNSNNLNYREVINYDNNFKINGITENIIADTNSATNGVVIENVSKIETTPNNTMDIDPIVANKDKNINNNNREILSSDSRWQYCSPCKEYVLKTDWDRHILEKRHLKSCMTATDNLENFIKNFYSC